MFQLNWRQRERWHSGTAVKPSSVSTVEQLVTAVGLTLWEEYCAECSAPQCCRSCGQYVPRALIDGDEEVHVMLTWLHFVGFGAATMQTAVKVNADNFGINSAVNPAIVYYFQRELISSTTMLMNLAGFEEARRSRRSEG